MKKNKERILKRLGKIIQKKRKEKYPSIRAFARAVGLSHVAVVNIENGKSEAKKDTLLMLADKLGLNSTTILAKAAKFDDDIENLISKRSKTVPQFLRTARNLTNEQWKEITQQVKKMSQEKKDQ